MVRASAALLLSLALAGCAAGPQARLASDPAVAPARYAWDGAGDDPNQPRLASEPSRTTRTAGRSSGDKSTAELQPDSEESWQTRDHIEAEQDARVNRALAICRGCLRPQQSEDARLAKSAD